MIVEPAPWYIREPVKERPDYVPSAYIMAKSIAGQGVDPSDEGALIVALMDNGYSAKEITANLEAIKHQAWLFKYGAAS